MVSTTTTTLAAPAKVQRDPQLVHFADSCCEPFERTLCGVAISSDATEAPIGRESCMVCVELHTAAFACRRGCR